MEFRKTTLRTGLVVLFFASTLFLSVGIVDAYPSPDESAVAAFAHILAEQGALCIPSPLNTVVGEIVHPRATVAVRDCILPGGFLGMPIFAGVVFRFLGASGLTMVTPVLALLAIVLVWQIVITIFDDERLADATAFLFMVHPAFWYYSGRDLMTAIAFLVALLVAIFFGARLVTKELAPDDARRHAIFIGVALGVALFLRTSELPWVAASFVAFLVCARKKLTAKRIVPMLVAFILALAVIGAANNAVYGSPWTFGYTAESGEASSAIAAEQGATQTCALEVTGVSSYFLPFGFHPRGVLRNVWDYGVTLFPLETALAALGAVLVLRRKAHGRTWRALCIVMVILSVWLGVVYGSWRIVDNPDPNAVTIGNSHVRYWLPLFTLGSVFAGLAVTAIADRMRSARVKFAFTALVCVLVLGLSTWRVVFAADGFVPTRAALVTFEAKRAQVLAHTESDAVVVVDRADKYLFPARDVVVPLRSDATYAALPTLVREVPTYYFGITLPESDLAYLRDAVLKPLGLGVEPVVTLDEETLYRFTTL